MELPNDYMPEWLKYVLTLVMGAGGVHYLRAVLENRRLANKDFREVMLDRIRELERVVSSLQRRMGNMRAEMAHLEAENGQLRDRLGERDEEQDDGS